MPAPGTQSLQKSCLATWSAAMDIDHTGTTNHYHHNMTKKTWRYSCLVALSTVGVYGFASNSQELSSRRRRPRLWRATPISEGANNERPTGRVEDRDAWIDLSSHSLYDLSGKSMYDRMDQIDCATQVHATTRYAVLSHGTQEDPIFCYFNSGALQLFQWPESEIYQIPSRYSAPEGKLRDDRSSVISKTSQQQFNVIPSAIRQTRNGSLFEMVDVLLWNVYNEDGVRVGQTALVDCNKVKPVRTA